MLKPMLAFSILLSIAPPINAKPLEPKWVPADAAWVVHVDFDAVRGTRVGDMIEAQVGDGSPLAAKLSEIERLVQIDLPADLRDATLFATGFKPGDFTLILRTNADRARLETLVSLAEGYERTNYHGRSIHTWFEPDRQQFATFIADDAVMLAASIESLEHALDAVDGRAGSYSAEAPSTPGKSFIRLLGKRPESLEFAGEAARVIRQMDSVSIVVTADEQDLTLTGQAQSPTEQAARTLANLVRGAHGFVALLADDAEDTRAVLAARAMERLEIDRKASTTRLNWPVSLDLVQEIVDTLHAHRAVR